MKTHGKTAHRRRSVAIVYILLIIGILWQSYAAFRNYLPFGVETGSRIQVTGEVKRPGVYRVPSGASMFEVLRFAGIEPGADLSPFDLGASVHPDQIIQVSSSGTTVDLTPIAGMRLEFFIGDVSIIAAGGVARPRAQGVSLSGGDQVLTGTQAQAQLSVNSFSRIDLSESGELVVDKMGVPEGDRIVTEVYQKSGICWYKLAYTTPQQLFRIAIDGAILTIGAAGADFVVEPAQAGAALHLINGALTLERPDGAESIQLTGGQSAVVYSDARPVQVTSLKLETSPNEHFSRLHEQRREFMQRKAPLNILLCGVPSIYYLISLDYERGHIRVVEIPAGTSLELFMQGVATIDQAMLFGGAATVSTVAEHLLDVVIPKYCVIDRDQLIWIGSALGGIELDVDAQSAARVGVRAGRQKLSGTELALYLSPGDQPETARDRQLRVIGGLFEQLRSRNIVITAILAQQLASGMETNITASELVSFYQNFTATTGWQMHPLSLPVNRGMRGRAVHLEPDLSRSRVLLHKES